MKKIFIVLGIVLVIGILIYANKKKSGREPEVSVYVVKNKNIKEWVEGDGEAKPVKLVKIGSDVTARIVKILKREGDRVKKGDTLCLLDAATYLARVKERAASLEKDIYLFQNKELQYERVKSLYKKGLIAKKEYEDAELSLKTYEAIIKQDSSLLEQVKRDLAKTIILSPIDGVVLSVDKEEGEMAIVGMVNTPGSVIMTLAEMDSMEVKGFIDETGILKVKRGQRVIIKLDALPGKKFSGVVYRIVGMPESSGFQGNVVTYPVFVRLRGTVKLFPGMSASMKILVENRDSVPAIPVEAIGRDKRGYYVWKLKKNMALKTSINKGAESFEYIEVKSGIGLNDTIITGPLNILKKLKDSTEVKVKEVVRAGRENGCFNRVKKHY